jgi:hypothetical protein
VTGADSSKTKQLSKFLEAGEFVDRHGKKLEKYSESRLNEFPSSEIADRIPEEPYTEVPRDPSSLLRGFWPESVWFWPFSGVIM